MSLSVSRRRFLFIGASAVALLPMRLMANGEYTASRPRRLRRALDVSCNANSIRFTGPQGPNPNNSSDQGPHPYYGASFVVFGTIYAGGLFAEQGNESGLIADGTPEFPDSVVGTWICRGWFVGDSNGDGSITPGDDETRGGIFTPKGRFVVTTQIYDLEPKRPGEQTLISDGSELIDLNTPFKRAITGGTGSFRRARGQVTQMAIGVNATGLFNFAFDFNIRPRRHIFRSRDIHDRL